MMTKFISRLRGFSHINNIKIYIKCYKFHANCHKTRKNNKKSSYLSKYIEILLENCLLLKNYHLSNSKYRLITLSL